MEPDRVVLVTGRVDHRGREVQIRASAVAEPDLGPDGPRAGIEALIIDLPAAACTPAVLDKLRALLGAYPGGSPVRVRFLTSEGATPLQVGAFTVDTGSLARRGAPVAARRRGRAHRARGRHDLSPRRRPGLGFGAWPFAVIPAIDVTDGVLGRYTPEGPRPVAGSDGDPVAAAARSVAAGARVAPRRRHGPRVRRGGARHRPRCGRSRRSSRAPAVQASGGIRTAAQVGAFLRRRRRPRGARLRGARGRSAAPRRRARGRRRPRDRGDRARRRAGSGRAGPTPSTSI